jgi:hypothetical protein
MSELIERLTARIAELEDVIALHCDPCDTTKEHEIIIGDCYKRFCAREEAYLAAQEKNCEHPWHRSNLVCGPCPICEMTVEQFNSELEVKP